MKFNLNDLPNLPHTRSEALNRLYSLEEVLGLLVGFDSKDYDYIIKLLNRALKDSSKLDELIQFFTFEFVQTLAIKKQVMDGLTKDK